MRLSLLVFLFAALTAPSLAAQTEFEPDKRVVYKQVPGDDLDLGPDARREPPFVLTELLASEIQRRLRDLEQLQRGDQVPVRVVHREEQILPSLPIAMPDPVNPKDQDVV